MKLHVWVPIHYEPKGAYQGHFTEMHTICCAECKKEVTLPYPQLPTVTESPGGAKKWICPIRQPAEVAKTDYPAKRRK